MSVPPQDPSLDPAEAEGVDEIVDDGPVDEAVVDQQGDVEHDGDGPESDPPDVDEPAEVEGPRRRARRERAERRAAQERAEAIEQARREAKRRLRAGPAEGPRGLPRGTIRGLKMVLAVLVAISTVVGLGLILYFTPLMSVREIEVSGLAAVSRDEVLDAARVASGTPLLQIDTGSVAERIATIRRVASVRVQRKYPSVLGIAVIERVPLVYKDFPDGPHLFDRDGVDFASAAPPTPLAYFDVQNPGPGDPSSRAALAVMTALAPEVAGQISRVAAPSVASITLTMADGRIVVWGSTDRTAEKAQKLAALLTQPGHTYDVSSPDLPTVR